MSKTRMIEIFREAFPSVSKGLSDKEIFELLNEVAYSCKKKK